MVYADLHVHTTASDGLLSLEEIIREAKKRNIEALAVTDHDVINTDLRQRTEIRSGIELITGVEVKTMHNGTRAEILCYFLDPGSNEVEGLLEKMRERRIQRMEEMVKKFNSLEEGRLTLDDVKKQADGPIGRPHFARAIAEKGFAEDRNQAFEKYAKRDSPYYVPLEKPDSEEVIRKAKDSGAFTSLAHPCNERIENPRSFIGSLAEIGLDGCEVNYPYGNNTKEIHLDERKVEGVVEELGLIKTGGSDFHDKRDFVLGSGGVVKETLEEMKSKVGLT